MPEAAARLIARVDGGASSNGRAKGHGENGAHPPENTSSLSDGCDEPVPGTVQVTLPILAIALLVLCSLSYLAGEIFRLQMPDHPLTRYAVALVPQSAPPRPTTASGERSDYPRAAPAAGHSVGGAHTIHRHTVKEQHDKHMPRPKLQKGKAMPETKYTFGQDVANTTAVRGSFHLHIEAGEEEGGAVCEGTTADDQLGQCPANSSATTVSDGSSSEEDEEEHLPSGQHLLVDIKNVDGTFLDSEKRLAHAMVEVVNEARLTLLSYHCHSLVPAGVSCVGVLLESHISFHTWPMEGVITLDLFTCGSNPLLPAVETIERLFAIPQPGAGTYHPPGEKNESYVPREEDYVDKPRMVWSHVLRGFRPPLEDGRLRVLENDVTDKVLSRLELDHKVEIANVQSDYQHIGIYDVIDPRFSTVLGYERSVRPELKHTYEGRHPELFRPDRKVFLDGVALSTRRGNEAYHEALVHPGMFAHPYPKRAAVIGGGEGSALREVLKHRTVEHVKMIEIDEVMVNISRQHLPDWSDCSDLVGSADSCFDDPRTELLCQDALAWFIDRFEYPQCDCEGGTLSKVERKYCKCDIEDGGKEDVEQDSSDDDEKSAGNSRLLGDEEKFDVIIMDAFDPQEDVDFAGVPYNNDKFLESLYGALTDEGVLVMQLGKSPRLVDPAEELGPKENRASVMSMVEGVGFASMHVYEENHCGFGNPWSFLVACKSYKCRNHWYAGEAPIAAEIQNRIARTKSGSPALKYFDGATMVSYQVPSKAWETVFCRRDPQPAECSLYRGLDPKTRNYEAKHFEVKMSSLGEGAGRGLFAKVDIPKGSFLAQDQAQKKVHFAALPNCLIHDYYENMEDAEDLGDLLRYMDGYGFEEKTVAEFEYYVDSSHMTFVNHGCNGTSNMGEKEGMFGPMDGRYWNEALIDPAKDQYPEEAAARKSRASPTFSPVHDRHLPGVAAGYDYALRDIRAGEEVFSNYLFFCATEANWAKEVRDLQAQCRGEAVGQVKADELEWENEERALSSESEDS